ncbi:serine protease 27-like [Bombina bombina]|uniref:serine protease 27-like n=1 Tax=Bombina bombina TaxID=8345 RepID=UPI00235A4AE0|nr:serine protease 27-like [Bombina bombina]
MPALMWLLSALLQLGILEVHRVEACGRPILSNRIVGGQDASQGEWPWQVSLQINNGHVCGGSLITDTWVMTAAHCFEMSQNALDFTVYLGAYQLSNLNNSHVVSMKVKQIIIHPDFTEEGSSGDIALIELQKAVTFNAYILPVCLPSPEVQLATGTICWTTGWGNIKSGVPLKAPQTLQEVDVALIDRTRCEAMYQYSLGYNPSFHLIQEDMICAGYKEGLKDSCQGDSGGPLVCQLNNAWIQLGITSWGLDCARPNQPGVYTRVQSYLPWIKQYVPLIESSEAGKVTSLPSNSNTPAKVSSLSLGQTRGNPTVKTTESKQEMTSTPTLMPNTIDLNSRNTINSTSLMLELLFGNITVSSNTSSSVEYTTRRSSSVSNVEPETADLSTDPNVVLNTIISYMSYSPSTIDGNFTLNTTLNKMELLIKNEAHPNKCYKRSIMLVLMCLVNIILL